jgi:hypothetical protein
MCNQPLIANILLFFILFHEKYFACNKVRKDYDFGGF